MPVFANQLGTLNYASPESIKIIANHIRSMQEQLEYRLSCLDSSNISEINMDETSIISKDGSLISILNSYGESIAGITVGPDSITAQVSEISGKMSALELTVDEMSTMLYDPESGFSVLSQTVNDISGTVVDLENGLATSLSLSANGLIVSNQDGKAVVINGDQITAGTINSKYIRMGGFMTIYQTTNAGAALGGYMGYRASDIEGAEGGMEVAGPNRLEGYVPGEFRGYGSVHATNNGSKLSFTINDKGVATKAHRNVSLAVYGAQSSSNAGGLGCSITMKRQKTDTATETYQQFVFTESAFYAQSNDIRATLGTASQLWGQIYSTNSAISTSDRNAKNSIDYDIDPRYDELWSLLKPCTGKYNDGTSDRTHMFLISQDVEEAIEQAGLTSKDFAAFIKSPNEDGDGYIYALRYEEFIPLCIRHIQQLEARVAELERS